MRKIQLSLLILVALCETTMGQIFSNPITGTNPNTSNPYATGQTVDANISVSGIGRGSGISGSNANDRYNASGFSTTTIDLNDYFVFTLTPNTGRAINLTGFTYTGQASGTGPVSFAFRSSLDNYTANIGSPTATGATIDLTGSLYQDITSFVTFRLYGWGGTAAGGTCSVNSFQFDGAVVLPIALISFDAKLNSNAAQLSFSTATETNNNYFSIERSADNRTFTEIGQVKGAGDSYARKDYTYTDAAPLKGINYYRLRQVDFDGKFTYSPVVSVLFGKVGGNVRLSPQPTSDQMRVIFDEVLPAEATWEVFDFTGRLLQSGTIEAERVDFQIDATMLAEGTYVLRITSEQTVITKSFQKK